MQHIQDDELRAYAHARFLHRTHSNGAYETTAIQEHIASCCHCRERYAAMTFAETESVLQSFMQAGTSYPSIATQVMQQVHSQNMAQKALEKQKPRLLGWRFASIPGGIALVATFLVIVTFIALANILHNGKDFSPNFKTTSQGTKNISVPTLAPQEGAPFISICHQSNEVALKHMYICGYNYTPGSRIELIISLPGASSVIRKTLTAEKDGTVHYALYIASCDFVPATITAISGNDKATLPSAQQTIQFGTCPPVSGVVGPPEQRASWSLRPLISSYRKEK